VEGWKQMSSLQGVILVAGEGTRLRPLTFTIPKPLISVFGKPLVVHEMEALKEAGITDLTLVIGHLGWMFREALSDGSRLGVSIKYVSQPQRLGIAHAIYRAIEEGAVSKPFVVHLGDNFFEEGVKRFVDEFAAEGYDAFIVLTRTRDPTRFGYVILKDGRVFKLIEKPREPPPGGYTLTGFYGFRDPDLVAKAFRDLKQSQRGEYEITDLVQWFVDRGYRVGYTITQGWWKDMGTPEDLLDLMYLMLDRLGSEVRGDVRGEVRGRVFVDEGAVVEGGIYGPAYVGRKSYVSKDAILEHYVDVEREAVIEGGYLSRTLVLEQATLKLPGARLVNSIIGPRTYLYLNKGDYTLIVGERNRVEMLR